VGGGGLVVVECAVALVGVVSVAAVVLV
jgi:hypothetical protein